MAREAVECYVCGRRGAAGDMRAVVMCDNVLCGDCEQAILFPECDEDDDDYPLVGGED